MTNEYKENLLKYFTGTINKTDQSNEPVFDNLITYNNDLATYIANNISGTFDDNKLMIIQGKDGTGKDMDSFILVGTQEYNSKYYSFIVLLDKDLNPIQIIEKYTSGVMIGQIFSIKVADDGTYYFLEYNNANDKIRLILSNNILVKSQFQSQYFCKIRISYNLPDDIQDMYNTIEVFKNNTGSYYGIIGATTDLLILETLKIEVGEENVWTSYIYDFYIPFELTLLYESGYCYWDEDDFTFEAIFSEPGFDSSSLIRFYLGNENTIEYNTINTSNYVLNNSVGHYSVQIIAPNHEYIGVTSVEFDNNDQQTGNQKYYLLELNNNNIKKIYEQSSTYTPNFQYVAINLKYKNGTIFYFSYYPNGNKSNMDYGLIFNRSAYKNTISDLTQSSFYYFTETFAVTIQYNLVKYIMPMNNNIGLYIGTQIFNVNNYNGSSYEGTYSVMPNSVNLYNNNNVIFSRNLYNKMVYNDTCVSTLQIPNTMLNDITISKNNLMSYNNNIIVNDNTSIIKNIYETLDINYYNVIKMENRNDLTNIKENVKGAIRINDSANKTLDVYRASASCVRILFQDQQDSTHTHEYIFRLNDTQITITNNVATYDFVFYCPTGYDFLYLQIVSGDSNTTYLTIDKNNANFESGKYYRIQQEATII